jgi:hypothetical protein
MNPTRRWQREQFGRSHGPVYARPAWDLVRRDPEPKQVSRPVSPFERELAVTDELLRLRPVMDPVDEVW